MLKTRTLSMVAFLGLALSFGACGGSKKSGEEAKAGDDTAANPCGGNPCGSGASAASGKRIVVEMSQKLSATANKCWKRVGGFATLHEWHPAIATTAMEGEGVGAFRTLTLGDGATIKERLDTEDADGMSYEYTFIEHPLPVDDYHGKISVTDNGDGTCTMHWGSNFVAKGATDDEARGAIEGIYQAGFDALKGEFGG